MSSELMLAFWPDANLRQYWYPQETNTSIWLSFRAVEETREDEGNHKIKLDYYGLDGAQCSNVGLYVWASQGYSSVVELKAHEIYSATASELTRLAKWLTKYNRLIEKADIPPSFGVMEKIILTLHAMKVKCGVKIDWDGRSQTQFEIKPVETYLADLKAYADPIAEMEALRTRSDNQ